MGQTFSSGAEAGKDSKAVPRAVQPSRLFGLDTLNALLAEQVDPVEEAAPRDGPSTIEAWLVREGLQEFAADEPVEDLPDLAASAASMAASAADPETDAILQAWEDEALDPQPFHPPATAAEPAAAREEARRRELLGAIDRLTATAGAGRTSRSA
ncbi:MAG: hypothetical protein JWP92_3683 [Caulobacter sp.]|nr:hypothetical protein [Caulobacter sp.]